MPRSIEQQINQDSDFAFLDSPDIVGEFRVIEHPKGTVFFNGCTEVLKPFTYVTPRGRFTKKLYINPYKPQEFIDFAVFQPDLPTVGGVGASLMYNGLSNEGEFEVSLGHAADMVAWGWGVVNGVYDKKGRLKRVKCQVGEIPPQKEMSHGNNYPGIYSGPYWALLDITTSPFSKGGGKVKYIGVDGWYPFGSLIPSPRQDGNAVQVQKNGNFLVVEAGCAEYIPSQPNIVSQLPLRLDNNAIKSLILNYDPESALRLASHFKVSLQVREKGITLSTI